VVGSGIVPVPAGREIGGTCSGKGSIERVTAESVGFDEEPVDKENKSL
jgi:hypothetical protein